MPLTVGTRAPDFTLKSKQGDNLIDVRLSERLEGNNVVLLFFPLAFTGVCTTEMCDVSQGLTSYRDAGAEVIGISVDSPFAQEAWARKENIAMTLVSDLNKEVAKAYDVLFPGLAGIGDTAARAAFVIDRTGTIRYAEQTPSPKEVPNFDAIKSALANLG